jgi:hypothetical protein
MLQRDKIRPGLNRFLEIGDGGLEGASLLRARSLSQGRSASPAD